MKCEYTKSMSHSEHLDEFDRYIMKFSSFLPLNRDYDRVLEGPVARKGNTHTLRTLYLLDPDGNRIRLVELSA